MVALPVKFAVAVVAFVTALFVGNPYKGTGEARNEPVVVLYSGTSEDGSPLMVVDFDAKRLLRLGDSVLGVVYNDFPDQAAFTAFAVMESVCYLTRGDSAARAFLQIGLGAGVVPHYVRTYCSSSLGPVHAVEVSSAVADLARRYFEYQGEVVVADGRELLLHSSPSAFLSDDADRYGVIIMDAWCGRNPTHLLSARVLRRVRDSWMERRSGVLLVNMVSYHSGPHAAFAAIVVRTLRSVWRWVRCFRDTPLTMQVEEPGNIACFASSYHRNIAWALPPDIAVGNGDDEFSPEWVMRHFESWEVLRGDGEDGGLITGGSTLEDGKEPEPFVATATAAVESAMRKLVRPMLPESVWEIGGG